MYKIIIFCFGYLYIEIICIKIEYKLINGIDYKYVLKYILK